MAGGLNQQDFAYRIPVGIAAFLLFIVGLALSFWFAGIFGFSPPLFWAAFVCFFVVGVFFLAHPKLYLGLALVYYGFLFNGLVVGRYYVPIPFSQVLDELILAVPLGVIAMHAVERKLPLKATCFPFLYIAISIASWQVNDVPAINFVRIALAFMKFYIYWYFARTIGPWTPREKRLCFGALVAYAVIQFFFNVIWHRGIFLSLADAGTGTIGHPHYVGYISAFALFLLMGWFFATFWSRTSPTKILFMLGITGIIGYNMVFLTDTKHLLFMLPVAALPFFFHHRVTPKFRLAAVIAGGLFILASGIYMTKVEDIGKYRFQDYVNTVKYSGKGKVFDAIVKKLPDELPMPLLGAGPGNFCSSVAVRSWRPLATKYVTPYVIRSFRYQGHAAESSVLGTPRSSFYILLGEFGPLVTILYFWFWLHVMATLWKKSSRCEEVTFESAQQISLISCLLLLLMLGLLVDVYSIGLLALPVWTLVGVYWDGREEKTSGDTDTFELKNKRLPPDERFF